MDFLVSSIPASIAGKELASCVVSAAVLLVMFWCGTLLPGPGMAMVGAVSLIVTSVGLDYQMVPETKIFEDWLLLMGILVLAGMNESAGAVRMVTAFFEKVFKKLPLAFPICAASWTFAVCLLTGTSVVALGMMPLYIEIAKDINLRPNKVLVPSIFAAVAADLTSPVGYAMVMYARLAYLMSETGGFTSDLPHWRPGRSQLFSLMDASMTTIPSAYVGVIFATLCAMVMGKSLRDSKTFKRRLIAGECHCNYPQRYLTSAELAAMARNLTTASARQNGFVLGPSEGGAAPPPEPAAAATKKPLPDFSQVSMLSEGDYVYTHALVPSPSAALIDINNRTEAGAMAKRPDDGAPAAAYVEHGVARKVDVTHQRSFAIIALVVTLLAGCWAIIYAALHHYEVDIISSKRNATAKQAAACGYFAAALIITLMLKFGGSQTGVMRYFNRSMIGALNGLVWQLVLSTWAFKWMPRIARARLFELHRDHKLFVFLSIASAIMSNSWHGGGFMALFATVITDPAYLPTQRLWFTAILTTSCVNVIPWHTLSLVATKMDDTKSTRLGSFLFDNFITLPVLIGAAVTTAVGFGIATGILGETKTIGYVSRRVMHNWANHDNILGQSFWGIPELLTEHQRSPLQTTAGEAF